MADEPEGAAAGGDDHHELSIDFHLDAKRIEDIRKCLANGKLTMRTTKVSELKGGGASSAYLWD